ADQRVGGGGRHPPVPGEEVPGGRAGQCREQHSQAVCTVDGADEVLSDRAGHALAEEGAEQGHQRGQGDRNPRGEGPGHDGGDNGVRGVVEAVGESEEQSSQDHREQGGFEEHGKVFLSRGKGVVGVGQASLTAMLSMVLATCSKASAAASNWSTTSLSLSTVSASYSPPNRWASRRR